MLRAGVLSFTLLACVAARADGSDPTFRLRGSLAASFGTSGGVGTHDVSAPMSVVELSAKPTLRWGRLRLALPLSVAHLERLGEPFDTSRGDVTLIVGARLTSWLRVGADLGVDLTAKLGWPDHFQPRGDVLLETDRFSHLGRNLGARVVVKPSKSHELTLRGRYSLVDGADDPSFQAIDYPDHLTPADHVLTRLELAWALTEKKFRARAFAELFDRNDFFRFAEDAGTGQTHASPGGDPPNPLRELRGLIGGVAGELRLSRRFRAKASYELTLTDDVFQGYRSSIMHQPALQLTFRSKARVELSARVAFRHMIYGDSSYAPGRSHPPLDYGDRRADDRVYVRAEASAPLAKHLSLTAEVSGVTRWTNFPDYVAGVHPESRRYDIDWDYEGWSVLIGLRAVM